ncbi:unnamed protein product (macronuclear) [Paramecium tetraurelia]|uniref:Uncharacterized protein n=1 Tax=Paramecium tetraurelia TaxID=5888 RepID=A0C3Q1_PARTE|nr:uncharacterized protein GSPATT00034897001 [Paramecium tetraurelia]CAK65418.1 unnamed protein product [Paramecium tetraurelia]|eukprot:XP_001432815.1 hypothetical protein (macronuclear) [Paramecium tetraurelia strain d4-2]
MLFEYPQQPAFIQKYELIKQFFVQLQQVRHCEQAAVPAQKIDRQQEFDKQNSKAQITEESLKYDDSTTSRQVPRQRRAVYITKKQEQRKSKDIATLPIRPSDIMMIEQQKEKIDQFCQDNKILYENNIECMYIIKKMAKMIKKLKSQSCQDHINSIEHLQLKLRIKDAEIAKKNECIQQIREKYNQMMKVIEEHTIQEEQQWQELQAQQIELETENLFLRKLLSVNFNDDQIKQLEQQQNEVELQFFDNFCISRKDLDKQAILEYEKMLQNRKSQIEQQYVDWNMAQINSQYQNQQPMHQPLQDLYAEEKEMMMKKQSNQLMSKEDKQRIMDDLLKPISSNKQQQINVQEVKQKQLDILAGSSSNSSLQKKQSQDQSQQQPKKLAIDIDTKESIPESVGKESQAENKLSSKEQLLSSLNQGMGKTDTKNISLEKEGDQVITYNPKNHMQDIEFKNRFTNPQTIMYDGDDYMEDDDEDDVQVYQKNIQLAKQVIAKAYSYQNTKELRTIILVMLL